MSRPIEVPRRPAGTFPVQYTLQAALATLTVCCLLLAYLRPLGMAAVGRCGTFVILGGLLGWLVGSMTRRAEESVWWSAMGALAGYLGVLSAYVYHWTATLVWPMVGAATGAAAVWPPPVRPFLRMAAGAGTATVAVVVYHTIALGCEQKFAAEWLCAGMAGAVIGLAAAMARWLETGFSISRPVLAISLTATLIAGHWLAVHCIPGW